MRKATNQLELDFSESVANDDLPEDFHIAWEHFQSVVANKLPERMKYEMSYLHMLVLRKVFSDWAEHEDLSPEEVGVLLGYTKQLQDLCDEVGKSWNPPELPTYGSWATLAREILNDWVTTDYKKEKYGKLQ